MDENSGGMFYFRHRTSQMEMALHSKQCIRYHQITGLKTQIDILH